MFTVTKTLAYATRFDLGNAKRAKAAYDRRTGGEGVTVEKAGDDYVLRTQCGGWLRAVA